MNFFEMGLAKGDVIQYIPSLSDDMPITVTIEEEKKSPIPRGNPVPVLGDHRTQRNGLSSAAGAILDHHHWRPERPLRKDIRLTAPKAPSPACKK